MRVRLLGPVAAGPDDDRLAEPPGLVPAAVLAHLALAQGHVLTPDVLAERVWDDPPDNVRNALQAAVSRVRRAYGDDVVETSLGGYRLAAQGVEVDAVRAEALLGRAREGDLAAAEAALTLWHGEPLAGLTSSASVVARHSLEELRRRLVTAYAELLVRRDRSADAVPLLQGAAAEAPFDEPLHALLMRALAGCGRAGDALTTFDQLRRRLADELGIDPSAEVASTFAAILGRAERDGAAPVVSEPQVLTVLLTDVVGSARLWRERPEDVPRALLAHHALVSDVVARHGGTLPPDQGEGDARMAVFASPVDAVGCAADLQHELAALDWPAGLRLHVRTALARGPVVESDGNVFGAAVPLCARLRSLAHGDQVLLTADVAADLPADPRRALRPLGRVPLRDFDDVDVLQLDDRAAPREFPPLRTSVRLPAQASSVVGRELETTEVQGLVRRHRLVTLTGLGGSGKTTLALQAARAVVPDFPDGVQFVDLSSATTPHEALDRIGAALAGTGSSAARDALRSLGPRTLLLLDNLEQIDAAGPVVGEILAETAAHVLATSRAPIGANGEVVRPVGPLGERDALELLTQRATAYAPGYDPDPADLVRVVRATGGVPLALELAAGRLHVLGAGALAESLAGRLSALSAARGRPERQLAVEALLADTWDVLAPTPRHVLTALAVVRAPVTAPRLADLAGLPTLDAADALDDLVSRGLVRAQDAVGSPPVFAVLELVRRHAIEAAAEEDVAALRVAHADLVAADAARDRAGTVLRARDDVVEALRVVGSDPRAYDVAVRTALAAAALDLGRWDDAVVLLDGADGDHVDNLIGVALVRSSAPDDVRRGREHLRRAADGGDADAAAALGGSLRDDDPGASHAWYLRALELDPTDLYALGNVLEAELAAAVDDSPLQQRRDALEAARARRRAQLDRGQDLPWSAYDLARTGMWSGDDDALHLLLDGVAASTSPRQIETTLASFRRNARTTDAWTVGTQVLEVALRRATSTPSTATEVLVLAGASSEGAHQAVMAWEPALAEAVSGTALEIVSGGTDRGVSALAAQVAASVGARSVGWLPSALPDRVAESDAYAELRRTVGTAFSLREPLAYWQDLLDRGIDPALVHVLGLGGGALTALELRLAQALGASVAVGVVKGSPGPLGPRSVVRELPCDAAALRAWLRSSPVSAAG